MQPLVIKKPCIDICEFNKAGECKACGRTRSEKKQWKKLSAQEKQAIWERILDSHGRGNSKEAKALRKLYGKGVEKALAQQLEDGSQS
ncbi:MAG: DUF1289 domain-containing protein [Oleiphilaceae bacterium]|nr:DUF1289 domain-containing protein [Oleiphilaceae bacterium]